MIGVIESWLIKASIQQQQNFWATGKKIFFWVTEERPSFGLLKKDLLLGY